MNVILLKIYTRRNRGSAEQIFQIIMEKNLSLKAICLKKTSDTFVTMMNYELPTSFQLEYNSRNNQDSFNTWYRVETNSSAAKFQTKDIFQV